MIRIVPIPGPAPDLTRYDLICITSVNGVDTLFSRLADAGRDHRAFAGSRVAAVGSGTAAALAARGVEVDIVPERSVAEGLLEALAEIEISRALILARVVARDALPDGLRARGVEVDVMALYETVPESLDAEQLAAVAAADYVTFTSSSTVRQSAERRGRADLHSATACQHRSRDERHDAGMRAARRSRGRSPRHRRPRRCDRR